VILSICDTAKLLSFDVYVGRDFKLYRFFGN